MSKTTMKDATLRGPKVAELNRRERARQAAYDEGYEDGREVGRRELAAELGSVLAVVASGDLCDLTPRSLELWARFARVAR